MKMFMTWIQQKNNDVNTEQWKLDSQTLIAATVEIAIPTATAILD